MADVQKALATQVRNIESRTGKTLSQLAEHISASGLAKHSEIVALLKHDFSLGYGDANMLALRAKQAALPATDDADPLDAAGFRRSTVGQGCDTMHLQMARADGTT